MVALIEFSKLLWFLSFTNGQRREKRRCRKKSARALALQRKNKRPNRCEMLNLCIWHEKLTHISISFENLSKLNRINRWAPSAVSIDSNFEVHHWFLRKRMTMKSCSVKACNLWTTLFIAITLSCIDFFFGRCSRMNILTAAMNTVSFHVHYYSIMMHELQLILLLSKKWESILVCGMFNE